MKLPKFFNYVKETVKGTDFVYTVLPPDRSQKDLSSWKTAITLDEGYFNSKWYLLDIYKEQLDIDGHLAGLVRKRTAALLQNDLQYVRNEVVDESVSEWMEAQRFKDFIKDVHETLYYGHSLFWFGKQNGDTFTYKLINRKHVDGRKKVILKNQQDGDGMSYKEALELREAIEVGDPEDLGLLKTATYYSIIKRNLIADWANYAEEAGRNFRFIKYKGRDVENRNQLLNALKASGGGGIVSIPDGIEVDFQNMSSSSQNELFENFMDYLNKEQSKLILGQTMTTDDGSSRSQAEVHANEQELLLQSDKTKILNFLNYDFYDYFQKWGIKPGGRFIFGENKDLNKMIDFDLKLKQLGYVFTQEEIKDRYGLH